MTKIEFDILTFINSSEESVTGTDVLNHFKGVYKLSTVKSVLDNLNKRKLITSMFSASYSVSNVLSLTNEAVIAIEKYCEDKELLNKTSKDTNFTKYIAIANLVLAAISIIVSLCKN